jgi:SAM-dependent methyltransferase
VEDMPYHKKIFDIVVCTDILEHVLDLNKSIAKILMILKQKGILLVRVPYREDLSWYLSTECSYKYSHLRNFDEHSLHSLFERIFNCNIIEVVKAGYDEKYVTRLKMASLIPRPLKWRLSYLLGKVKAIRRPLYEQLLKKLYDPFEINMVIIKQ